MRVTVTTSPGLQLARAIHPPLQLAVRKFVGLTPPAPSLIRVCASHRSMPSLSSFAARPAPRGQFRGSSEGPAIAQERQDRPSKPTTGYFASIISSVPQADVDRIYPNLCGLPKASLQYIAAHADECHIDDRLFLVRPSERFRHRSRAGFSRRAPPHSRLSHNRSKYEMPLRPRLSRSSRGEVPRSARERCCAYGAETP
jgi:hypothetical protein